MDDEVERSHGVLVLTVWLEPGDRLRARITRTRDVRSDLKVESYAASKAEVMGEIDAWLDGFVTPS